MSLSMNLFQILNLFTIGVRDTVRVSRECQEFGILLDAELGNVVYWDQPRCPVCQWCRSE